MNRAVLVLCLGAAVFSTSVASAEDDSEPVPLFLEGYAGQVSYRPGEEVALHVSTSAARFQVEVARLGARREVVLTQKELAGRVSPIPEDASSHGCRWPALAKFSIPETWRSGYYHVALRAEDGGAGRTARPIFGHFLRGGCSPARGCAWHGAC